MNERPMHDVEQGLPRRGGLSQPERSGQGAARLALRADGFRTSGSSRRYIFLSWKFLVPVVALILAVALLPLQSPLSAPPATLTYSQLTRAMDAGRVASVDIEPTVGLRGLWKSGARTGHDFVVIYPASDIAPLLSRAEKANIAVTFRRAGEATSYTKWLAILIQVGIVATLLFLMVYSVHTQMGGKRDVGDTASSSDTTFDDVAGTQGAAEELREVVDFLSAPARFKALGARVPKGVLLVGPPGTGKTLLARAVAGEAGVPFYFLSGSEVTGFVVGLGAHRIRSLFKKARKHGGVIFIDELDALGGARGKNRSHNEDDRTLNQLLVEMDGFSPTAGVVVVAATNRPEDLDTALKRPGRFDRIVNVGLPSSDGREAILRLHASKRNIPLSDDVDLKRLARLLPNSSGAELANLLNEAAIAAVRDRSVNVMWSHIEIARDRMLLGKERPGFRATDREWKTVAYHEAGHALAGVVACPEDGLHKVTIQPRGQAMGVAHFSPDDDQHLHSRKYMESQIIKGLGGRVAEEITFGAQNVTGGAESDLVHVNRVARRMVYRLGLSEDNSLLVYDDAAGPLSGDAQARMDASVNTLLQRLYGETREIMIRHRPALEALAQALLERETLDGAEAMRILRENGVA